MTIIERENNDPDNSINLLAKKARQDGCMAMIRHCVNSGDISSPESVDLLSQLANGKEDEVFAYLMRLSLEATPKGIETSLAVLNLFEAGYQRERKEQLADKQVPTV